MIKGISHLTFIVHDLEKLHCSLKMNRTDNLNLINNKKNNTGGIKK